MLGNATLTLVIKLRYSTNRAEETLKLKFGAMNSDGRPFEIARALLRIQETFLRCLVYPDIFGCVSLPRHVCLHLVAMLSVLSYSQT